MAVKKGISLDLDQKVFDVAIVGTGLSGLIAANQLTKKNASLLFLKERRYRLSYSRDGYRFVPFSNFSERYIQAELLKKIPYLIPHREIRRGGKEPNRRIPFQIILPKARIDLYHERSLLQREWRREFKRELEQIEVLYAEFDRIKKILDRVRNKESDNPLFPIDHQSLLRRWLSPDPLAKAGINKWLSSFSPEFKKYLELQVLSQGNLLSDSYPISLVSYLLSKEKGKEWDEGMDLEKLTLSLLERFVQSGGKVEEVEGLERVEIKRGEGFTLIPKEGGPVFQSRLLVLNAPLHNLARLFDKKRNPFLRWERKIRPHYTLIPFFLGIREKVIPVGMKDLLISLLHLERTYEDGNLLLIGLSPRGDENQAPEGRRALTALGLLPFERSGREALSDLQDGVINHLKHLFPFLENHLEWMDRNWADEQRACWSYSHFLYETETNDHWRRELVPFRISKNLYFSGKENFPYLGLEGEILAGLSLGVEILKGLH